MAGRPGPGGSSGPLVGMCIAIGLAFVCAVLLVVLWTHQEELKIAREKADNDYKRVLQTADVSGALKAWHDQSSDKKPLARAMNEELGALGKLLAGEAAAPAPGLSKQLSESFGTFLTTVTEEKLVDDPAALQGLPVLEALRSIYTMYKAEKQANVENQATIQELNGKVADLTSGNAELQKNFNETANELQARIDQISDEWNRFRSDKEQEFTQIEAANQKSAEERTRQEQEFRAQLSGLNEDLAKKVAANQELRSKIREFQILPKPGAAARQADGRVLLAKAGEKAVFVDLGASDHMILGMRFAVYSPDTGVPSTGVAKAVIELASIGQDVSECRIVHMDELFPILEGDLIANPIYDRNRELSFLVIGAFDLDHDGRDDPNGKGTIEAVISEAGGLIADELTSRIDFVIVGARPLVRPLPKDPSPEQEAVFAEEQGDADAYNAILGEARSLSIPMLTQETFLNFLGRKA